MTQYEEIDIGHLGDGPVLDMLQPGDVVTIKGPGERDVLVREVTGVRENGTAEVTGWNFAGIPLIHKSDRTLTRIQRPVPALPTVEGDYILDTGGGDRSLIELTDKGWRTGMGNGLAVSWLVPRVREGATLTRVIPADEVKRPEVDVEEAWMAFGAGVASVHDDFVSVLRRVLEGEFDL